MRRPSRPSVLHALAGCALALACSRDQAPQKAVAVEAAKAGPSVEVVGEHLRRVEIHDPEGTYGDYLELVPPVRLPSSLAGAAQVSIRTRLPADAKITLAPSEHGPRLRFPPGTIMDRVEWVRRGKKRSLADVRGTFIDAEGNEWHHNYRRTRLAPNPPLVGYEWRADDPEATRAGVDGLIDALRQLPPAVDMPTDEKRERYLRGLRAKADCLKCHVPSRRENLEAMELGLINRGTDASSFFTPQTIFDDATLLESYGAFDPNLGADIDAEPSTPVGIDGYTSFECPGGEAPKLRSRDKGRDIVACDEGLPRARYALAEALAAGEPHAKRVCASRLALAEHMSSEARDFFEQAIRICESIE